ncbi:hypothetical protein FQA47_001424 [Oryzias melastigma]|uniref:Uncharacterized protein n=1 Tax=Oryzias melastigma TaxID=30732 RepID=A0A834FS79_ORYME|nr:hypothetical protein FQA47_001424 [Oryzias melastigma]
MRHVGPESGGTAGEPQPLSRVLKTDDPERRHETEANDGRTREDAQEGISQRRESRGPRDSQQRT